MRKINRCKDADWAFEVFDKAPYVTVSMVRPDGTPYGLPLSLVRKDDTTFYFHCASEGEKSIASATAPSLASPLSAAARRAMRRKRITLPNISIRPLRSAVST